MRTVEKSYIMADYDQQSVILWQGCYLGIFG